MCQHRTCMYMYISNFSQYDTTCTCTWMGGSPVSQQRVPSASVPVAKIEHMYVYMYVVYDGKHRHEREGERESQR